MVAPGASRQQLARTLNTAYARGLLSENTFAYRLNLLLGERVVNPRGLVGDLSRRQSRPRWPSTLLTAIESAIEAVKTTTIKEAGDNARLLALDWSGAQAELSVGRHGGCDVVLSDRSVSRRHARLAYRDGSWVIQDLESTNGTTVNGVCVGRCELRPGDHIAFGHEQLRID